MIEKYSNRPDVGINLSRVTQKAFRQYHSSSSANTSQASDYSFDYRQNSSYAGNQWEYLRDETTSTSTNRGWSASNQSNAKTQATPMSIDDLLEEYS